MKTHLNAFNRAHSQPRRGIGTSWEKGEEGVCDGRPRIVVLVDLVWQVAYGHGPLQRLLTFIGFYLIFRARGEAASILNS